MLRGWGIKYILREMQEIDMVGNRVEIWSEGGLSFFGEVVEFTIIDERSI